MIVSDYTNDIMRKKVKIQFC